MSTNADRSVCTKRSMQDDGEEEDRKKRKEDLEVDTDAEEETVGGEEHEGGYGESESEHEDDWDDAFFIPDSDYSQYFLDKSSDKRFYFTYFVRYPFGFYARQLCYACPSVCQTLV